MYCTQFSLLSSRVKNFMINQELDVIQLSGHNHPREAMLHSTFPEISADWTEEEEDV